MKKLLLGVILILLFLLTLTSCDHLDEILSTDHETEQESYVVPEESTADHLEKTTEEPTEEATEPPTEAPKETVSETSVETEPSPIPEETTASEEDYLSDLLDTLQAEGCDMEQLTFSGAAKNGVEYRYTVTFPKRIFRKGETVEINVTEIVHVGDDLDLQEDMETGLFEVCMDLRGKVIYSNTNEYRWKEGNTIFFEIPEDFESGAYMLCLFINEWGENIGPIVIY